MSKDEIVVGKVYAAKISGKVSPVRIDGESRHGGWDGTNVQTNKKVHIKSPTKLRYEIVRTGDDKKANPKATAKASEPKTPKAKTKAKPVVAKPKKVSAIDAAAKVLSESKKPLNCKELVEAMATAGLWQSPNGKTPHATLYSAILREINTKGKDARFVKSERGKFAATRS